MIDWMAKPIAAGQGGDPWRVAVCAVVAYQADQELARRVLPVLLERWPLAVDLARAKAFDLALVLDGLSLHHRRARTLKRLARAWLLGDRHFNKTVLEAVRRYCDVRTAGLVQDAQGRD